MSVASSSRPADRERERELFARLPEDPSVRGTLVEMFLPLAEYLARRFAGRGESVEDLVQVASLALLNAIDRFDVTRDVQFSTYAAVTIVGELKRHFRDKGWAIRVPRRLQEVGLRVNAVLPELAQELGRSPTIEEIAARCEATSEEILDAMEAVQAYSTTSLETPIGEEGVAPIDTLGGDDPSLELLETWTDVAPAIRALPARERKVLYLRFYRGFTQSEIAREVGVSQMHVSRILAQTLRVLREVVGAEGEPPAGPEPGGTAQGDRPVGTVGSAPSGEEADAAGPDQQTHDDQDDPGDHAPSEQGDDSRDHEDRSHDPK